MNKQRPLSLEAPEMKCTRRIHFVGIGGVGMGGIAEVLLNLGFQVSGSDLQDNAMTQRLSELGAVIHKGHHESYLDGAEVVVVTSMLGSSNPEVVAAQQLRIPIVRRAEMLAELMRLRFGIAVAGTHGKTTTTSLTASILGEAGLDPTFVIGGRLNRSGSNAGLGASRYLVAEADESDASFLYLKPMISVVTNIDADHLSTYGGDFNCLKTTFSDFLHHLPFYGLAILCGDDPSVQSILPTLSRHYLTYGFNEGVDAQIFDYQQIEARSRFKLRRKDHPVLEIVLNLAGQHNALNATAAVLVATELGIPDDAILKALSEFAGVGRRFQIYPDIPIHQGHITLVDDYGHHPVEMRATINAARQAWPNRRLVLAFQPHRYTRTRDLFEDFTDVVCSTDLLLLLEVYPAGEAPIPNADGRALCRGIRQRGKIDPIFVDRDVNLHTVLRDVLNDGDILLMQGAGDIGAMALRFVKEGLR